MRRTAVVALGGNALTRAGQAGAHEELEANAAAMARSVRALLRAGWRVVLVHGNGPQVGNLAIQQEEGAGLVPAQPLFSLGAMTQGQLGSLLTLALATRTDVPGCRGAVAVTTHTVVDPADTAFSNPTKPIGPFFTEEEADALGSTRGWAMREDAGRGYRRVVPSPEPLSILEVAAVRSLLDDGCLVIAAGGGGVPVVPWADGYRGVDAVVDKDHAAQCLATGLDAEALVLVTGVESVLLDYGTPAARPIAEIEVDEARRYLEEGQFPEGSMAPKVRAAVRFLDGGGEVAVVTTAALVYGSLEGMVSELEGRPGTRIVRVRRSQPQPEAAVPVLLGGGR